MSCPKLVDILDDVTWKGEVMVKGAPDDALRLLNLNLVNMETRFNSSCYEVFN
ncbi:MAG: hypothetical protein QMC00_02660 [Pseudomonadales bacterium]|jgi:hypothetical protein